MPIPTTEAPIAFPEEPTTITPAAFGLIASVPVDKPAVIVQFNGSASDQVLIHAGTIRTIGRPPSRPIRSYQLKSVNTEDTSEISLEFTEGDLDDRIVPMAVGPQGPAGEQGPAGAAGADGADGAVGPAGPAGADGQDVSQSCSVGAYLQSDQVVSGGSSAVVIFNLEDVDVGNDYAATTGVFIAPEDGDYRYVVNLSYSGTSNPGRLDVEIDEGEGGGWVTQYSAGKGVGVGSANGSFKLTLSAGDQVRTKFYSGGNAGTLLGYDDNGNVRHCHLGIERVR